MMRSLGKRGLRCTFAPQVHRRRDRKTTVARAASQPGPQKIHQRRDRKSHVTATGAASPTSPRRGRKPNDAVTGNGTRRQSLQYPAVEYLLREHVLGPPYMMYDMNMNMKASFITGYYGQKVKDVQERHATTRKRDLLQRAKRDMLQFAKETYDNLKRSDKLPKEFSKRDLH
ncbi:hypothetical protein FIBSPDRAFT_898977 [Athelia psychrophila]|uniref:Uncharacterized protein n=1 Tax=Athelia psychrophila TaxID=1759441 RepID=A0A166AA89_9AGAM|nr:hypothetical protein FIBSPDRAFT_898977 [Fibularhizoctonia sp. CBS 109695]